MTLVNFIDAIPVSLARGLCAEVPGQGSGRHGIMELAGQFQGNRSMPRVKTVSKKRAILDAASRDFAEKDFHEVLIDDIATSAKIGKGTIYRYCETKEELYFAAILQGFDELYETLVAQLPAEASPARRLERIAREILQFFWRRRYLLTLLSNDERFAAHETELARRRERVNTLVQQA